MEKVVNCEFLKRELEMDRHCESDVSFRGSEKQGVLKQNE